MKTVEQILALIASKAAENEAEVEAADKELKTIKNMPNGNKGHAMVTKAMRMMVLKDKMIFHKAVVAALNDLKEEIIK